MSTQFAPVADLEQLAEILTYRRASGSKTLDAFLDRFVEPVFGQPEPCGTYLLAIGDNPTTLFCAHYDSVEVIEGRNTLSIADGTVRLATGNAGTCLGADDGVGIWLILSMIAAGKEGVYALFADEEHGCLGSTEFAQSDLLVDVYPEVTKVIAFDRPGTTEIVTHMCGIRTCSDDFGLALAGALGMGHVTTRKGGLTDSLSLIGVGNVREATNVAVGYSNHHTAAESLDMVYAAMLLEAVLRADFEALPVTHIPDPSDSDFGRYPAYSIDSFMSVETLVWQNPDKVAALLREIGFDDDDLREALGVMA